MQKPPPPPSPLGSLGAVVTLTGVWLYISVYIFRYLLVADVLAAVSPVSDPWDLWDVGTPVGLGTKL